VSFTVFPAVDLKGGKCVQLVGGDPSRVRFSMDDPLDAARVWVEQGARALHVIDLDGALKGKRVNANVVRRIVSEFDVFTQLGGGIRDVRTASELLGTGVNRVIMGTAALRDPGVVERLVQECGSERVMVSIDTSGNEVVGSGWREGSGREPLWWGELFQDAGAGSLLYTDVDMEGLLDGVNTGTLSKLVEALKIPVIFAGGVTTIEDVAAVKNAGAAGVVIGSAIYAKKISLPEALAMQEA